MRRWWAALAVALAAPGLSPAQSPPPRADDPFAMFRPWVDVTPDDRAKADRGEVVVRMLPASGQEVAVLAVAAISTEPDAFAAHIRDIESLKRSSRVPAIRRFADPPQLRDLSALELDDDELDEIRQCRPGDCGLKLSTLEMVRLQQAGRAAGDRWRAAVQAAFREAVLDRVTAYLDGGLEALPPYQDKDDPVRLADVFGRLLQQSPYLAARLPALVAFFGGAPRRPFDGESFLYWSRDLFDGRAIVSVTHVALMRPRQAGLPLVVTAGRQIFASHYTKSSLSLTCLTGGDRRYLVYLNRSEIDVLGGFFGPLKRAIMNGRVQRDATAVLEGLRARLEATGSGP